MKVYKFGGASVNSADAIRNMAQIVRRGINDPLVVVVSAMGKTTNMLERIIPGINPDFESCESIFNQVKDYHLNIVDQLFEPHDDMIRSSLLSLFDQLYQVLLSTPSDYNYDYDRTVCFGELISTTIISAYLNHLGISNKWVDIRSIIRTDNHYREGRVDWHATESRVHSSLLPLLGNQKIIVTQGFIAGTEDVASLNHNTSLEQTTTLGREGSDYSASILAYCLNAQDITIWKDVDGFLNADPKFFDNTVKINKIPYVEAMELAYYGASVIHPKTIKPIQNKGIRLNIKSFLAPDADGSVVGPFLTIDPATPLYIFKNNQVLISVLPKDFSFIAEDNLQTIFAALADLNVKVNIMQNSALSFSFCIDYNEILMSHIMSRLAPLFRLKYNTDLQLITIRYYNQSIIDHIVGGRQVLLQQRSRITTQLLVEG